MPDMSDLDAKVLELADRVRADDDQAVLRYLDDVLGQISVRGADANEVLPVFDEAGIGFSTRRIDDAPSFWRAILVTAHRELCGDGENGARQLVGAAVPGKGSALVAAFTASLGIPPYAIGISVVLAGVVVAIGLGGLCMWLGEKLGQPS